MTAKIYSTHVNVVDYGKLTETEKDFIDRFSFAAGSVLAYYLTGTMSPKEVVVIDTTTEPGSGQPVLTFMQYAFGDVLRHGFEPGLEFLLLAHPKLTVDREPVFKLAIYTLEQSLVVSCYVRIDGILEQLQIHFKKELEKSLEFVERNLGKSHADMKRMVTNKDYISSLHVASTLQDLRFGFKVST